MQVSFMDAPSTASVSDGTSTHTGWHIGAEGTRKVTHIYLVRRPDGSWIQTLSEDISLSLTGGLFIWSAHAWLRGSSTEGADRCAEK